MKTKTPEIYQHYKGYIYEKVGEALLEADKTPMVIYRPYSPFGNPAATTWVRPAYEFEVKFTKVEEKKLEWSKELPTTVGTYLRREPSEVGYRMGEVVNVYRYHPDNTSLITWVEVGDHGGGRTIRDDNNRAVGREWYGPIPT